MPSRYVYVSNAEDGAISGYAMDLASGDLTPIGSFAAGANVMPMAVSPDNRHLYAAIRSAPLSVATFAIDPGSGRLGRVATAPLPDSMCSIATDATGRFLLSASYGGSVAAVSPIGADGAITAPAHQVVTTGKHAHAIRPDRTNRWVLVPTLGGDHINQYRFDAVAGRLTPATPPTVAAKAGDGPRHLVISPDNRFVYVLCELTGIVIQFALDDDAGTLTARTRTASVPADAGLVPGGPRAPGTSTVSDEVPCVWAADLQITPDGRFLYATERTTSKIALFTVAAGTGAITYIGNFATETQPRGIGISPDGRFLVASGEKSDRIIVFAIDRSTGNLTTVGRYPTGKGANWVEFVDLP